MKVQHLLAAVMVSAPILLTGCVYAPQHVEEKPVSEETIERVQISREGRVESRQTRVVEYKENQEAEEQAASREEKKAAAKARAEEAREGRMRTQ